MFVPLILAGGAAALELKRLAQRSNGERGELKTENERLREEINVVQTKLEEMEEEMQDERRRLEGLAEENEALRDGQEAVLGAMRKQREQLSRRAEELRKKQESVQGRAEELEKQNQSLVLKLEAAEQEKEQAVEQATQAARRELSEQVSLALDRFSRRVISVEQLGAELQQLGCRLQLSEAQREALEALARDESEPLELTIDSSWEGHGLRLVMASPQRCAERLRLLLESKKQQESGDAAPAGAAAPPSAGPATAIGLPASAGLPLGLLPGVAPAALHPHLAGRLPLQPHGGVDAVAVSALTNDAGVAAAAAAADAGSEPSTSQAPAPAAAAAAAASAPQAGSGGEANGGRTAAAGKAGGEGLVFVHGVEGAKPGAGEKHRGAGGVGSSHVGSLVDGVLNRTFQSIKARAAEAPRSPADAAVLHADTLDSARGSWAGGASAPRSGAGAAGGAGASMAGSGGPKRIQGTQSG